MFPLRFRKPGKKKTDGIDQPERRVAHILPFVPDSRILTQTTRVARMFSIKIELRGRTLAPLRGLRGAQRQEK